VCRFTHFGPYLVHIEISKTSYNSERREYILPPPGFLIFLL
jgi:hypothetical protein